MSTPQLSHLQELGPYLVHLDSLSSPVMSTSMTIASRIARLSPALSLCVLIHCHLGSKDYSNEGHRSWDCCSLAHSLHGQRPGEELTVFLITVHLALVHTG